MSSSLAFTGFLQWFLAFLGILTVVVHLWGLEQSPPGAYVDETSIGYNAYSILRTGADEHGISFPLYFKAFGEYKNPVFIYSLVPLIQIFDLSVWTIRFGAALFGLATALVLGLIIKESSDKAITWLLGFLLAGLTPWAYALSRVSFEVVSFPFFIALAWWSWLKAVKSSSVPWYLLAGLFWGVAIFSYSAARLMAPLLFAALLVSYYSEIQAQRFRPLLAIVPFAACLLVLLTWSAQHPGTLTTRFAEISIARDSSDPLVWIGRFVSNYLKYLSPHFLFLNGDANLRHHTGHGGELFLFTFPALLAGLADAWQRRAQPSARFALIGFLLFPLAASLTADSSHSLRAANGLPFAIVLIAWGGAYLRDRLSAHRAIVIAWIIAVALELGSFYLDYFLAYPARAQVWFKAGIPEAVKISLQSRPPDSQLYFSLKAFRDENFEAAVPYIQPYVQFLFFGKLDPKIYQEKGLAGFGIHSYKDGMNLPPKATLLLKSSEEVFSASGKILVFPNPDLPPPNARLIDQVKLPISEGRNVPAYQIFQTP